VPKLICVPSHDLAVILSEAKDLELVKVSVKARFLALLRMTRNVKLRHEKHYHTHEFVSLLIQLGIITIEPIQQKTDEEGRTVCPFFIRTNPRPKAASLT